MQAISAMLGGGLHVRRVLFVDTDSRTFIKDDAAI